MRTLHFVAKISLFIVLGFHLNTVLPANGKVSALRTPEEESAKQERTSRKLADKGEDVSPSEIASGKGWISGRYYVSRRVNVAGATVKLDSGSGKDIYLTVTDERGKWNFKDIPEGKYDIEIFKEGFEQSGKRDIVLWFPFKSIIELKAIPSAKAYGSVKQWSTKRKEIQGSTGDPSGSKLTTVTINGKALSQTGEPLSGTQFILKDINGRIDPYRGTADAAGNCIIEDVRAGLYDLAISSMTYFPLRLVLDVDQGMNLHVIMVPQPQDYHYTPLDLIPPEEPLPPPFLLSHP